MIAYATPKVLKRVICLRWSPTALLLVLLAIVYFKFFDRNSSGDLLGWAFHRNEPPSEGSGAAKPTEGFLAGPKEAVGKYIGIIVDAAGDILHSENSSPMPTTSDPQNAPGREPSSSGIELTAPTTESHDSGSVVSQKGNIAFCVAVKDQYLELPEFLTHHYYNIGIKHFYLMDDGSQPPLSSWDADNYYGIPSSAITFHYYNSTEHNEHTYDMQLHIYNQCNELYGPNHTWLGFFDTDEFIGTYTDETLADILEPFEADPTIGAFGINWRFHTSAGLLTRPESVRKSFDECMSDDDDPDGHPSFNRAIKSLVKPSAYWYPISPHKFNLLNDARTVGEDGDQIDYPADRIPITRKRVALHHYAMKSKAEFQEKIDRGNAMGSPKDWGFWDIVNRYPVEPCLEMTGFDI